MNNVYQLDPQVLLLLILARSIKAGASDAIIKPFSPPMVRIHGEWVALEDMQPLPFQKAQELISEGIGKLQKGAKAKTVLDASTGSTDLAFSFLPEELAGLEEEPVWEEIGAQRENLLSYRFRCNVLRTQGDPAAVIRLLDNTIRPLEELGLPEYLYDFAMKKRGLILVTGSTGSGKSTTLAALIHKINQERRAHIVTIEDPIEFVHIPLRSVITQIEVGSDTPSFADALVAALRQAPDVILVGELRDQQSMAAALSAAETGHLVMGTLHTNSAAETIHRVFDFFGPEHHPQVAAQLASTLELVIAQDLIPAADGSGRVLAYEIMTGNTAVRTKIASKQPDKLNDEILTGSNSGMRLKEHVLQQLVVEGRITLEAALAHANNPEFFNKGGF